MVSKLQDQKKEDYLQKLKRGEMDGSGRLIQEGSFKVVSNHINPLYSCILDNIHQEILVINQLGTVAYANPAFASMLNRNPDELIGSHIDQLLSPNCSKTWNKIVNMPNGDIYELELLLKDGHDYRVIEKKSRINQLNIKKEQYCLLSFIPMASKASSGKKLTGQSEGQMKMVIENFPDSICRINKHMMVEYVNPAFESLAGLSKDDVKGKYIKDISPLASLNLWEKSLKKVFETRKAIEFNVDFCSKDKDYYYLHNKIIPIINEANFTEAVLVITQDITKHAETEKKLTRLNRNLEDIVHDRTHALETAKNNLNEVLLREQEAHKKAEDNLQQYKWVIEAMPLMAWTATANGTQDYFNKKWNMYTGQTKDSALNNGWIQALHPDDRLNMQALWQDVLKKQAAYDIKVRINRKKDNIYRWHLVHISDVLDNNNKLIKWVCTFTDIHEQVYQTERLNAKNKELLAINNYLDNFVHALAHDLRTPVANLQLLTSVFNKAPESNKPKLAHSINRNVAKMDLTLRGLIQVIETQGNKVKPEFGINLKNIINEILAREKINLQNNSASVVVNITKDLKINYVKDYLYAIVQHLISNAIKYKKDGVNPEIEISAIRANEGIMLTIEDNGTGINLERDGDKLFKPFKRLTSRGEGLGIGLHIIHTMVNKNGGYVKINSTPDKGTSFNLFLKEYV